MNKALPTFAVAIAVLVAAMILPRPVPREVAPTTLPLPEGTITAVRITSRADVTLRFGTGSGITGIAADAAPMMRLDGTTLVLEDRPRGEDDALRGYYRSYTLDLPATVEALSLAVDRATLQASVPVAALEVTSTSGIIWNGDAGRLVLRHTGGCPAGAGEPAYAAVMAAATGYVGPCGQLRIDGGAIGSLDAYSAGAYVWLQEPQRIGELTLHLAERADYGLGRARGADHVRVVPIEAPIEE
ncbi:hypothetical protein [Arenimonas composti]|uniref:Uncharacterized protein n=1 Tax=Arenimonas composti TR7-09 = DSM 18010 TaxID=1121013 RepID=A0A091C022_9GAMM|nr:hypothetical protein [Arenimonas composti]KFN49935.1 hypothetical protein P873_08815 [Arenimonas composti TR7-09 = DSM 18010]